VEVKDAGKRNRGGLVMVNEWVMIVWVLPWLIDEHREMGLLEARGAL
jgi:hypothetical protein